MEPTISREAAERLKAKIAELPKPAFIGQKDLDELRHEINSMTEPHEWKEGDWCVYNGDDDYCTLRTGEAYRVFSVCDDDILFVKSSHAGGKTCVPISEIIPIPAPKFEVGKRVKVDRLKQCQVIKERNWDNKTPPVGKCGAWRYNGIIEDALSPAPEWEPGMWARFTSQNGHIHCFEVQEFICDEDGEYLIDSQGDQFSVSDCAPTSPICRLRARRVYAAKRTGRGNKHSA